MGSDGVAGAGFAEQFAVVVAVLVVDGDGGTIDAALGDMERNVGQDQACNNGVRFI